MPVGLGNSSEAYLEWPYRIVSSMFWVPLTVFGICGNLMVVLVVMTVRGMKTPTNCYLVSLAVADFLFFISSTPVELSSLHLPEDIFLFGRIGCSILRFLPILSMNASSLSITAFTVERYIGICHPMKARYICTVKRAQLIILVIWSCSVLYNSTWLFLTDLKPLNYTDWPNAYQCTFSLSRSSYKAIFLLDLFAFYWIPLVLYLVLYGSMARILVKARFDLNLPSTLTANGSPGSTGVNASPRKITFGSPCPLEKGKERERGYLRKSYSTLSSASNKTNRKNRTNGLAHTLSCTPSPVRTWTPSRSTGSCSVSGSRYNGSAKNESQSEDSLTRNTVKIRNRNEQTKPVQFKESKAYYGESLNKARVQVVKMLIVIVVVFALFWLPYRGLVVYNSFTKKPWIEKWYILFAKTMVMVNGAINPILYNLMSGKFRGAFILMFKRCFGKATPVSRFNSEMASNGYASTMQNLVTNRRLISSQTSNATSRSKYRLKMTKKGKCPRYSDSNLPWLNGYGSDSEAVASTTNRRRHDLGRKRLFLD